MPQKLRLQQWKAKQNNEFIDIDAIIPGAGGNEIIIGDESEATDETDLIITPEAEEIELLTSEDLSELNERMSTMENTLIELSALTESIQEVVG